MSWLFSRALAAEYSPPSCLAELLSAPLSVMPTQHKFWRNDKTMESSDLSQFGLTCAVSTAAHGEALLMRFLAASRVRTYRPPAPGLESSAAAPACGSRWLESSMKYSRTKSTWKTHRSLWDEALPWSSVTLPNWGMTLTGVLWEPDTSAPLMPVIAPGWSGESFPTPSVAMAKGSSKKSLTRKDGRSRLRNRLDYWVERDGKRGRLNPIFVEWVMGWPSGWTDLQPLEMDKYREWRQQHSPLLAARIEVEV